MHSLQEAKVKVKSFLTKFDEKYFEIMSKREEIMKEQFVIPKYLLLDKNLNPTSKLIYSYLYPQYSTHLRDSGLNTSVRIGEICEDMNLPTHTLKKNLKKLESSGYVEIEKIGSKYLNITFNQKN